jgi:hypothetical protein
MTTTSSSDYLDYKKRKALDTDFFPDRNSSTYVTNKQYTSVVSTPYRNEDLICENPKRFGVHITHDDALATHDTSLERKQLHIVSRKPISKYQKQKDPNYMKYEKK